MTALKRLVAILILTGSGLCYGADQKAEGRQEGFVQEINSPESERGECVKALVSQLNCLNEEEKELVRESRDAQQAQVDSFWASESPTEPDAPVLSPDKSTELKKLLADHSAELENRLSAIHQERTELMRDIAGFLGSER